jgi:acetyltransferase-like isoleucine patch superfamily enzyme
MKRSDFAHPTAIVDCPVGSGTRVWAYSHLLGGAAVGSDCNIGDHCFVEGGAVIGDGVTIKNGNSVWSGVTLENGVFLGPGVILTNDRRPRSPRLPEAAGRYATDEWLSTTLVRHGATIGAGAIIVAGTTIGAYAFVGAGALVTRDVRDHEFVIGQPASPRGWVCRCGEALTFADRRATCPHCGLEFERDDDVVRASHSP